MAQHPDENLDEQYDHDEECEQDLHDALQARDVQIRSLRTRVYDRDEEIAILRAGQDNLMCEIERLERVIEAQNQQWDEGGFMEPQE